MILIYLYMKLTTYMFSHKYISQRAKFLKTSFFMLHSYRIFIGYYRIF